MLMQMRALTAAARTICYATAVALDVSVRAKDPKTRALAAARGALLTPIAKAFSTDIGNEVASLGVQIHGGMGFIEETGAAQHFRDARITPIYEGTNGIQSIDLVTRKLAANGGASVWALLEELSDIVKRVETSNDPAFGTTGRKTARRARRARPHQPLAAGARHLRAERCAGGRDAVPAAVRLGARRLHARQRSARRARSRRRGRRSALRHAGAVFCRERFGAGDFAGAHGDRQRRSGQRRGRGVAGVTAAVARTNAAPTTAVVPAKGTHTP